MDRKDLKIQALREALRNRVSEITDAYEDRIADLRIEVTELNERVAAAEARLAETEVDSVPEEGPAEYNG